MHRCGNDWERLCKKHELKPYTHLVCMLVDALSYTFRVSREVGNNSAGFSSVSLGKRVRTSLSLTHAHGGSRGQFK